MQSPLFTGLPAMMQNLPFVQHCRARRLFGTKDLGLSALRPWNVAKEQIRLRDTLKTK